MSTLCVNCGQSSAESACLECQERWRTVEINRATRLLEANGYTVIPPSTNDQSEKMQGLLSHVLVPITTAERYARVWFEPSQKLVAIERETIEREFALAWRPLLASTAGAQSTSD